MSRESRRNLKEVMLNEAIEEYNVDFDYMRQDQQKMALFRLYNIEKEFRDSVTAYKSGWYVGRDLLQPFMGLYHVVRGIGQIIGFPLFALVMVTYYTLVHLCGTSYSVDTFDKFTKVIHDIFNTTKDVVIDGVALVFHGLVQVVKAPFIWFFQIPFRSALTAYKGWQPFNDNPGMKALVDKYDSLLETSKNGPLTTDVLDILFRLQEKYNKAIPWDQKCNIDEKLLREATEKLIKTIPKYKKPESEGDQRQDTRLKFERRDNFYRGTNAAFLFHELVPDIDPNGTLSPEGISHATAIIRSV